MVPGTSKRIGADISRQLAAAGAAVVVNYASSKRGRKKVVSDTIAKDGKAIAIQAEVPKPADVSPAGRKKN